MKGQPENENYLEHSVTSFFLAPEAAAGKDAKIWKISSPFLNAFLKGAW